MIRPILHYGDKPLHRAAAPVAELTDEVQTLIDDMIETMYAAPGVGLAAPQVGVLRRVFVVDISVGRNAADLIVMVNPEIVAREGMQSEEEGCLSVPGLTATVARPSRLSVKGLDRAGQTCEIEATGLLARAFQHEMDHLDGKLFVDRLRGITRDVMLRKIHKMRRSDKW